MVCDRGGVIELVVGEKRFGVELTDDGRTLDNNLDSLQHITTSKHTHADDIVMSHPPSFPPLIHR